MTDYDRAFSFWRRLAETSAPVGPSKALLNTSAPFVLSNALWYPAPEAVAEAPAFYAEQGVLASVVSGAPRLNEPRGDLHAALKRAGFARADRYALRRPEQRGPVQEITTEQVSWTQTRTPGEVLAAVYDLPAYAVAVGQTLALAMQLDPAVEAFVAYQARPVGVMVTLTTGDDLTAFVLAAPTDEAKGALEARLTFEAEAREKRALVFDRIEGPNALEVWRLQRLHGDDGATRGSHHRRCARPGV